MDKFLVSVGNVRGYDSNQNLLFVGKTLIDSSFDQTLASTMIKGGQGNQLLGIYYHTSEVKLKITDAQWNLAFIAANEGQTIATGGNVYVDETVTLSGKAGSVVGTPLAVTGTTIYGWVTLLDGTYQRVTFTGSAFTASLAGNTDTVCVHYYAANAAASKVTVPANVLPSTMRIEIETELASNSTGTTSIIGTVQIQVPLASATGAFTIASKADGVSTSDLNMIALRNVDTSTASCTSVPYYATITEIVTTSNWYDDVIALAIQGGDFTLATTTGTSQLIVWAIPSTLGKSAFQVSPLTSLTFVSDTTGKATISAGGLVQGVSTGTSLLHASITAKATIEASATVTVP
jgi:hypothetical protein